MNSSLILKSSLRQMTRATQNGLKITTGSFFRPMISSNFTAQPTIRLMSFITPRNTNTKSLTSTISTLSLSKSFHTNKTLKAEEKTAETTAKTTPTENLTWNEFLALRIKRRKINVIASIATTLAGIMIGWGAVANVEIDPTALIYGFDPIKVLSVVLIVSGCLGYLAGPTLGALVFRSTIRKQFNSFIKKDVEFLHHIKTNRPDPRSQSLANPVTDYYGEKIGSLKDYRQWLRDGRVYRKKSEKFV